MFDIRENICPSPLIARLPGLTNLIAGNPVSQNNLSRGELGVILYYFYLSRVLDEEAHAREAYRRLENLLRSLTAGNAADLMNPTLAGGLAGLGMALEVLINEGFIEDEYDDFLFRLDQSVFDNALKKIENEDTDFLHGGTGGFHYLYYRLGRNPDVHAYLQAYVRALANVTHAYGTGAYIHNIYVRGLSQPGEVNLGLSHGMAASVLVLLNLYESDIERPLAESLIRKYIRFILAHHNDEGYEKGRHALYPNTVALRDGHFGPASETSYQGGLRWCYGDLNVAHLLHKAAAILDEPQWAEKAAETGLATLAIRDIGHARCHGSLFCHGATGIAHYYDYLHRISGLPEYLAGYDYWMQVAVGEFQKEEEQNLYPDISGYFLEGAVGSGLVIMNAMLGEPGYWEKIWLLS
jgi:lantibiotic modifying enzyme